MRMGYNISTKLGAIGTPGMRIDNIILIMSNVSRWCITDKDEYALL